MDPCSVVFFTTVWTLNTFFPKKIIFHFTSYFETLCTSGPVLNITEQFCFLVETTNFISLQRKIENDREKICSHIVIPEMLLTIGNH